MGFSFLSVVTIGICRKIHTIVSFFFTETAMLLPGKYAPKTRGNSVANKYDVRSNLRSYSHEEGQRYVIQYYRMMKKNEAIGISVVSLKKN